MHLGHRSALAILLLVATRGAQAHDAPPVEPGFTRLFDGHDVTRHFVVKGDRSTWKEVGDGVLLSTPGGDRIMSKEKYGDFILRLEWKVSVLGNSGVFLRVPSQDDQQPWITGFEVQITGAHDGSTRGERDDGHCAGSLYGVESVRPRPDETADVWHAYEIVCLGKRITVRVDGVLVVDGHYDRNPEMRKRPLEGYIGLQDSHTGRDGEKTVEYRNVRIQRLEPSGAGESFELLTAERAGWSAGKSAHGSGGRWVFEDGVWSGEQDPPGSGNGGILLSAEAFGDFEVCVETKPDWGVCSGFFLRSTAEGRCYQLMIDYHDGGNVGGVYGEGIGGFNVRSYRFEPDRSIVAVKGPDGTPSLPFPASEWTRHWRDGDFNELRARVRGNPPTIDVWLNGVYSTRFVDRERRLPDEGKLALQVHGGKGWPTGAKVRFRNVQVRRLAAR